MTGRVFLMWQEMQFGNFLQKTQKTLAFSGVWDYDNFMKL